MGLSFCRPSCDQAQSLHEKIKIIPDTEVPCHLYVTAEINNMTDDIKNNTINAIDRSKPDPKLGRKSIASSYREELLVPKSRIRISTDTTQSALAFSYSSPYLKQTIFVEEELLETLSAKPQKWPSITATQKLSLSLKSVSHIQKKYRLSEDLVIHQVTHGNKEAPWAKVGIYKLVIALKEVWLKLDLDKDNFLNLPELTRFCKHIWEEPKADGGAQKIMEVYAKENPENGINFREWCLLIKEEDPHLKDFVEEIYEIFVVPSS